MTSLVCMAHYPSKDFEYSELMPLSQHAHARLLEARKIRQELGGSNEHADQCSSIPGTLDHMLHGIHIDTCYKKFTIIISKARTKRKHSTEDVLEIGQVKQWRCQRMSLGVNFFPDYCYFCKKKRKAVKGKVQICHRLTLKTTEETIKEAAELRNDEDVLAP